jgi:hypothetical protein
VLLNEKGLFYTITGILENNLLFCFCFSAAQTPFTLDFLTDAYSMVAAKMRGFKLVYWQTTC